MVLDVDLQKQQFRVFWWFSKAGLWCQRKNATDGYIRILMYCKVVLWNPLSPARVPFLTRPMQLHNSPVEWVRKLFTL